MSKNLIVDGSNAAAASFFVIRKDYPNDKDILEAELEIDSKELIEKVVNNFNTMIAGMENTFQTDNVYIAWEGKDGTKWRKEILPEYKANRGEKPLFMIDCLNACRTQNLYPNFSINNAEGDDTVYALCKYFHEKGDENIICSSDKDFLQVAQEGYCTLYNFIKREFRELPVHNSISEKALTGDSSDNLKGLPKIGPVKAKKLLDNNLKDLTREQVEIYDKHCQVIGLKNNPYCEAIYNDVKSLLEG